MLPITVNTAEESGLCPVRQVLANVTGKWQSLILLALEDGPARFSSIRRLIGDITQRVLTENLRSLERDGYLTRTVVPGPPVEVHYTLTPLGGEMIAHLKPLVEFAARNHGAVVANRADYDSVTRGQALPRPTR